MSRTKFISLLFLIVGSMILFNGELKATHIVGGELRYNCLGNNMYEVTLTVRRDCENGADDAPFDDPAFLGVFDIFGSLQTHLGNLGRFELAYMGEDTITNSIIYDCSALGTPVCVHESVYRDTIHLPFNKIGYQLAYQRCCRNSILVNIEDPLETGATYHIALPINVHELCNSQPVFNNWTDVYLCVNEELNFDHSATDADGDQLVYKLCTPSQGGTSADPQPQAPSNPPYETVVWQNPYGLTNMLGGTPALSINPNTGLLTGMPDQTGAFLIGVCVEEYRNGELISTVRRDFEVNVRVCADPIELEFSCEGEKCSEERKWSFENNSFGAEYYNWLFLNSSGDTIYNQEDDGNPFEYMFPEYGRYTIILEGQRESDGCTARDLKEIIVGNPNPEVDFEIAVESCDSADLLRITDLSFDSLGGFVPNDWIWTINGNTAANDSSILYDANSESVLDISLEVTFDSGCKGEISRSIDISELFPDVNFNYFLNSCGDGGFELELSSEYQPDNLNIDSLVWTINDLGIITSYVGDPLTVDISGEDTEVSLFINFDNDCSDEITKIINASDLLPVLSIAQDQEGDCPEPGEVIPVTFYPEYSGVSINAMIVSYLWIVNGDTLTTEEVTLEVSEGDSLSIYLEVLYDNGCSLEYEDNYNYTFSPELDVTYELDCTDEGVKLVLNGLAAIGVSSSNWSVDGVDYPQTIDSMFMYLLDEGGNTIGLSVVYENGCDAEWSMFFDPDDYKPGIDFNIEVEACEGDTAYVSISVDSTIAILNETILINGIEYDSLPVTIETKLDSLLVIDYTVNYLNGCSDSYSSSEPVHTYLADPSYASELVSCTDDGIYISITDNTVYDGMYDTEWVIIDGDSTYTLSDPIDSILIVSSEITIIQNIDFDNGCSMSDTTALTQEELLPMLDDPILDYTITPVECFGDSGIFMFADMTFVPECMYITDYLWVINGQSCEGNPVTKTLPLGIDIDFIYTVTFNTGLVLSTSTDTISTNDTVNTNDYVDTLGIEIVNKDAGFCSDSISLCVANPDTAVNYEWSYDSDFIDILTTGISLDTILGDGFEGWIYVQTIDNFGPCKYGLDSIEIDFDDIDISFEMPFEICAGDTACFEVVNNDTSQVLSYLWKGGDGQLISGAETNKPTIGIAEDATEDFFFILCTENQYGCSSMDTIRFHISEPDTLMPFSYEPDSCGSLTIQFDEAPNILGDNAHWDFGDGTTGTGSMISHTYAMEGDYTVTLSDSSEVCASDPIMMDITVGMLDIEIVLGDTIYYDPDSLVTVLANTNGDPAEIKWCLEDGTNVGMGNPLEDFDAMMDTIVLIAKIEDMFGCMDQDTTVLVPEIDPEECLESVEIQGPDEPVVCKDEEFQLCVTMDEDCDLEDFSYLWDPEDCIVDGQGTPKVTVSATESKTIMVLITHIETGIDSVYTYDIEVSDPDPQISIPDMNIDANGDPFVCLGQSIELCVEPEDPDCEYTWSTGASGPCIEEYPEEETTYWVECVDIYGCVGVSDSITVKVIPPQCDESDIFIPNAFSPNGDGVNDVLYVRSKFIENMELVIVNSWGQTVFTSTDQEDGWDGTFNGEELGPDAFSYTLFVECIDGNTYVTKGNVSIVK